MRPTIAKEAGPASDPVTNTSKPDLGPFGVWTVDPVSVDVAVEIEKMGYGAVWVSSAAPSDLSWAEPILAQTN